MSVDKFLKSMYEYELYVRAHVTKSLVVHIVGLFCPTMAKNQYRFVGFFFMNYARFHYRRNVPRFHYPR